MISKKIHKRTRHNLTIVSRKGHREHILFVPHEATRRFASGNVPEAQLGIPTGTQRKGAIGRDDHVADEMVVALEGALGVAVALGRVRQVPNDDGLVSRAGQQNVGVFRGCGEAGDPVAVTFECSAESKAFRHGCLLLFAVIATYKEINTEDGGWLEECTIVACNGSDLPLTGLLKVLTK